MCGKKTLLVVAKTVGAPKSIIVPIVFSYRAIRGARSASDIDRGSLSGQKLKFVR